MNHIVVLIRGGVNFRCRTAMLVSATALALKRSTREHVRRDIKIYSSYSSYEFLLMIENQGISFEEIIFNYPVKIRKLKICIQDFQMYKILDFDVFAAFITYSTYKILHFFMQYLI